MTSTDPQVWLTHLCHVCARTTVRTFPESSRTRTCSTCLRLDGALGRRHDAGLLTPLDDTWARGHRVLHTRLHPDDDGAAARLRDHHVRRVVGLAEAVRRLTGRTPAPRWPAGPDHARVVVLDVWQDHYPPGPTASAAAYVEYVAAVHPWAREVEPLVTDAAALATLVSST